MKVNLSPNVRTALYILTMVLTPLAVYLKSKGFIGDLELNLWAAEVIVISGLAAFNVKK